MYYQDIIFVLLGTWQDDNGNGNRMELNENDIMVFVPSIRSITEQRLEGQWKGIFIILRWTLSSHMYSSHDCLMRESVQWRLD